MAARCCQRDIQNQDIREFQMIHNLKKMTYIRELGAVFIVHVLAAKFVGGLKRLYRVWVIWNV